jgi:hypothetical protein
LRRLVVDVAKALTFRQQSHPARAGILPVHNSHDTYIGRLAPTLNQDANPRMLKYRDGPKRRRRRVPERDMQPLPQALLVRGDEGAEVQQSGSFPKWRHKTGSSGAVCRAASRSRQWVKRERDMSK